MKAFDIVYRVFNESSETYVQNYSTKTHIWTVRSHAERQCRHNPANKVHTFKLVRVDKDAGTT